MSAYAEFIASKVAIADTFGFDIELDEINPILKEHQKLCVKWGVQGGRRAYFLSFGLGKTVIQLETLRLIIKRVGGTGLIVCPLGVRQEFKRDAAMLGITVAFVRTDDDVKQLSLIPEDTPQIFLTNYESVREGKIDPRKFTALSLDEAAILRGFGGTKTFRKMMQLFEDSGGYRFVATATPSPNELIELAAYADFLGIMDIGQIKTRFFKRDSTHADQLTLHPHKAKEFWLWASTWGMFLQTPSDLGCSDDGYTLPPLDVRWHELPTDHSNAGHGRDGQGRLIAESTISVSNAAREKRASLDARIVKLMEIRAEGPSDHRLIWHDLEDERTAIENAIPACATVFGSQDLDAREQTLIDFSDGKIQEMAGKPMMLGAGGNYQRHCHWAVFLGIGFRFYEFIQSIHRVQRFLQEHPVRIDLIYTEGERNVRRVLERKWEIHRQVVAEMSIIIREYGLATSAIASVMRRGSGVERQEFTGQNWKLIHNDSVLETSKMKDASVGLILTSIPFSTQYEYSPNYNDFGHNIDNNAFWLQMDYLTPQLFRVLQPGRVCAIHVKDRITPSGLTGMGFQTLQPFHCEAIAHYTKHGFGYLGMKTIVTDVVRENNQTYRLGWSEQCKDGTKMGVGVPEYLLLFRKPPTDIENGYADEPVAKDKPLALTGEGDAMPFDKKTNWKQPIPGTGYSRGRWQFDAHGFARSSGDRLMSSEELKAFTHAEIFRAWRDRSTHEVYDFEEHVALAEELDHAQRLPATFMLLPPHSWHPDVWTNITRMRTLNGSQWAKGKEMHLCPMQFDVAERVITQMSMKGETVYDPFSGLGTVPLVAVNLGRYGIGCELAEGYVLDAVSYLRAAEIEVRTPTLFQMLETEEEITVSVGELMTALSD